MVFYTQMFLSAFSCLVQNQGHAKLWRSFIIGRVSIEYAQDLMGFS